MASVRELLRKSTPQDARQTREQAILGARTHDSNRQTIVGTTLVAAGGVALAAAALPIAAEIAIGAAVVGGVLYAARGVKEKLIVAKQRRGTKNLKEFAEKMAKKKERLMEKGDDRLVVESYDASSGSHPLKYLRVTGTVDRAWFPIIPWRRRVVITTADGAKNSKGEDLPTHDISYRFGNRRTAVAKAVHDLVDQRQYQTHRDAIFGGTVPENSGLTLSQVAIQSGLHWGKLHHWLRSRKLELTGKPEKNGQPRVYYGATRVYLAHAENLGKVAAKRVDTTGGKPAIRRSYGWGKLK